MNLKLRKIDAIIVVILIIGAGIVLFYAGYLEIENDKKDREPIDDIVVVPSTTIPPASFIPGYERAVSPEDEGMHFDKIRIAREWWYFGAILDNEESDLKGWTVTVSFNHMAYGDLLGTLKPDMLIVTLLGPDGEEYGGMINKKRGLGIFTPPALEASSPGVDVTFGKSWAEGKAPEWHVHAEDEDIDKDHEITIDLDYFAPADPLWIIDSREFDKSKSNIASYMFMGCNVTGKIVIDGEEFIVSGTGHHEHSWSPHLVTRGLINGWDWCHVALDNGWHIYYSNYYPTPQIISSKTTRTNPFGSLVLTTDQGKTLTKLDKMTVKIDKTDERVFLFVKMPSEISVTGEPSLLQPLLKPFDIELDIDITAKNTYEKIWRFPTYVGMKIGGSAVSGTISWSDDEGDHEIELNGIGTSWSMRALL